jgi:hypothetical protein
MTAAATFRYFPARPHFMPSLSLSIGEVMKSALALVLALVASCTPLADVQYAQVYDNPVLYAALWDSLTACSGIKGPLGAVLFFRVERITGPHDWTFNGYWVENGNRIYLTEDSKDDPKVVMHEMMHAKLQSGDHPSEYFNGRCGDLL